MSKYVKNLMVESLKKDFQQVGEFIVVSISGLDGINNNRMRGALKQKGIHMMTVKNSAMRIALLALGMKNAADLFAAGPRTVIWGGDSLVDAAKELITWTGKFDSIQFSGAYLDGTVLDAQAAKELSKMKSRAELLGEVPMLAMSPGKRLAGAIAAPAGNIAGCIKSLVEKLEKAAA